MVIQIIKYIQNSLLLLFHVEEETQKEEKSEKKEVTVQKKTKPVQKFRKNQQVAFSHHWLAGSLKGHRYWY